MIATDKRVYLIHVYSMTSGEYIGDVIGARWYVKTLNTDGKVFAEVARQL